RVTAEGLIRGRAVRPIGARSPESRPLLSYLFQYTDPLPERVAKNRDFSGRPPTGGRFLTPGASGYGRDGWRGTGRASCPRGVNVRPAFPCKRVRTPPGPLTFAGTTRSTWAIRLGEKISAACLNWCWLSPR